jgi:hypothetical protein
MKTTHLKKIFILSLLVFVVSGCATMPKGSLRPDEVRLVALDIAQTGGKGEETRPYKATIKYQHGGRVGPAAITSSCATKSWSMIS